MPRRMVSAKHAIVTLWEWLLIGLQPLDHLLTPRTTGFEVGVALIM